MILLSEESWHKRLSLLFDVFKNSGSEEEIGYDDIVLATQVIGVSLHRLWLSKEWDQGKWGHLTEALADGAYAKVRYILSVTSVLYTHLILSFHF